MNNAGYMYYKIYYKHLSDDELIKISNGKGSEIDNRRVAFDLNFTYSDSSKPADISNNADFKLKTSYPGLLIGSGYTHDAPWKGGFNLGFFFDHTTGLPMIPGSSLKGLIRSAFPDFDKEKKKYKSEKVKYIISELKKINKEKYGKLDRDDKDFVKSLELSVFDGIRDNKAKKDSDKYLPMTKRDIFFEAVITGGGKANRIFGEDYITPHKSEFSNPIPIKFLKIIPNVSFKFTFRLNDSDIGGIKITAKDKKELFKQIILDLGAGAKTNVGYGQFETI